MRRGLVLTLVLLLAAGAFGGTWWALNSPWYSLYQIGKAIHDRQPRLFLAYVDVGRILAGQKDELISTFMAGSSEDQRRTVGNLVTAFLGPITEQVKDQVARTVADPERENIPSSFALLAAANVTTKDDVALVVLSDPQKGRRLRLGMRRHPEQGHWQVVEINSSDLRPLVEEYLHRRSEAASQGKAAPKN